MIKRRGSPASATRQSEVTAVSVQAQCPFPSVYYGSRRQSRGEQWLHNHYCVYSVTSAQGTGPSRAAVASDRQLSRDCGKLAKKAIFAAVCHHPCLGLGMMASHPRHPNLGQTSHILKAQCMARQRQTQRQTGLPNPTELTVGQAANLAPVP